MSCCYFYFCFSKFPKLGSFKILINKNRPSILKVLMEKVLSRQMRFLLIRFAKEKRKKEEYFKNEFYVCEKKCHFSIK